MLRLFVSLIVLAALAGPSPAEPMRYRSEFVMSYYGLTVGHASFDTTVDSRSYSVTGSVAAAGLGALFDDTKGTLTTYGRFRNGVTQPDRFRADYRSGNKQTMVELLFSAGSITTVTNVPPLKKRAKGWVPLGENDLRAVADPTAATLVRADSPNDVCRGQTIGIFDGEMRSDLTLSDGLRGTISIPGYAGDTVTCRMRFAPVSGYLKRRSTLEFLRTKSSMAVTFAPLGKTGVYAPVYATMGTEVGTITITARRLEAVP